MKKLSSPRARQNNTQNTVQHGSFQRPSPAAAAKAGATGRGTRVITRPASVKGFIPKKPVGR